MRDDLMHSSGPWKNHKYIKKIGDRYYYEEAPNTFDDKVRGRGLYKHNPKYDNPQDDPNTFSSDQYVGERSKKENRPIFRYKPKYNLPQDNPDTFRSDQYVGGPHKSISGTSRNPIYDRPQDDPNTFGKHEYNPKLFGINVDGYGSSDRKSRLYNSKEERKKKSLINKGKQFVKNFFDKF